MDTCNDKDVMTYEVERSDLTKHVNFRLRMMVEVPVARTIADLANPDKCRWKSDSERERETTSMVELLKMGVTSHYQRGFERLDSHVKFTYCSNAYPANARDGHFGLTICEVIGGAQYDETARLIDFLTKVAKNNYRFTHGSAPRGGYKGCHLEAYLMCPREFIDTLERMKVRRVKSDYFNGPIAQTIRVDGPVILRGEDKEQSEACEAAA